MTKLYAVDDDRAFLELVESVARSMGFEVVTVSRSSTFGTVYAGEPDAVIMIDMIMPEMDGLEVMNSVAARKPPGAIIFMSGFGDHYPDMAGELARMKGVKRVETLLKPVKLAHLRAALERARDAIAGDRTG
ncbi:MAG: response regulator [Gemmatimonas sp.]